jgi:transcription antitermination factor NusA-like protein
MVNTIDMQGLRNLNLFNNITRVNTKYCFEYNNALYFCVPRSLIRRAVGEDARNVRRISEILRKRVKIIPIPRDINDAKFFIETVVEPIQIKEIEINDKEIVVGGNVQTKAALIGRNKRRLLEMQSVIKDFFKRDFRVQ